MQSQPGVHVWSAQLCNCQRPPACASVRQNAVPSPPPLPAHIGDDQSEKTANRIPCEKLKKEHTKLKAEGKQTQETPTSGDTQSKQFPPIQRN